MNLVALPLIGGSDAQPASITRTAGIMGVAQHLIAALLTVIGVARAITGGVPLPVAVLTGVAILAWHTAGSFLLAQRRSARLAAWWLLGLVVVWLAAVAVSAEFVWVAFLLWLLAGHLLPILWGVLLSLIVLTVVITAPIMHHGTTTYANVFGPAIGSLFAFGISLGYLQLLKDAAERERLLTSLTRKHAETAALQDELAVAQRHSGMIAERTRLSRDIHDTVAQALSSMKLVAHAAGRGIADDAAGTAFQQIESLAGDSLADVRRIVAALAPAELEEGALAVALQRMLTRLGDETGLDVEFHVDETLPNLPIDSEVALLRAAQSALANIRQHADATRVVMSVIDAVDAVRLDILDNGRGFDVDAWEHDTAGGSSLSYGIRFMKERMRDLGGGVDIESTPGEGTAISLSVPVHPEAAHTASEEPV